MQHPVSSNPAHTTSLRFTTEMKHTGRTTLLSKSRLQLLPVHSPKSNTPTNNLAFWFSVRRRTLAISLKAGPSAFRIQMGMSWATTPPTKLGMPAPANSSPAAIPFWSFPTVTTTGTASWDTTPSRSSQARPQKMHGITVSRDWAGSISLPIPASPLKAGRSPFTPIKNVLKR